MEKEIIARNFGVLRRKLELSQEEFASYLSINRVLVSYYENGSREIPLEILEKCSTLFGIELIHLIDEDENKIKSNLLFAFRSQSFEKEDLQAIADFKKIIMNFNKMKRISQDV